MRVLNIFHTKLKILKHVQDFYELFSELTEEKGLKVSEIARATGISLDRLRNIKYERSQPKLADWNKLYEAYGDANSKDKLDQIDEKLDKIDEKGDSFLERLLAHEERVANLEANQKKIMELFGPGGDLDQAFEVLAKEYGVSAAEVKEMFEESVKKQLKEKK